MGSMDYLVRFNFIRRITYQSEVDRWKDLAIERLAKMEQLNSQLEERHSHEVRLNYFVPTYYLSIIFRHVKNNNFKVLLI